MVTEKRPSPKNIVLREAERWIEAVIAGAPGGVGRRLRAAWWRRHLAKIGDDSCLEAGLVIGGAENISLGERFIVGRNGILHAENGTIRIGNHAALNFNVFIGASEGGVIEIGDDVLIGPNSVLRASNHRFDDAYRPIRRQGHTGGRIEIGDDVWIGANTVIVGGVTVGSHAVVAAGAVVTRDVKPWTIVGGVPAKEIAKRNRQEPLNS